MSKRKLLSMFVICSMIVTLLVPSISYGASFNDTKGHWAESYINKAVQYGFVQGYPDGTFMPDKSVTRAEFTTMVNKALGNTATSNITFTDVPYSEWFYQDVSKAYAATYVGGYEDNTFKPNSPITRQEAAVMISRIIPAYGSTGNLNAFPDRGDVADWAFTAFQKVNGKNYIGAYNDGGLHPLDNLTRAQTAKIICDILDNEKISASDPVVRTNRTTLSNTIYSNGVTIHKDLDDGDATIENCVILGNLSVQGGGNNTVTVSNSRVASATVEKSASSVRLLVRGESVIATLTAAREATIQTSNLSGGLYGSGINNLLTLSSSDITLEGSFPKVTVNGSSAKLRLSNGSITNLTVASNANKSDITVDSNASVSTVDVNAESYFHGTGTISRMNVNANGVTYEKKPGTVITGSRVDEPNVTDAEGDIKYSPANGATKVKLDAKITITFNTAMTLYSGKAITSDNIWDFVELREETSKGDKVDYSATINSAKTIITITPDEDLNDDTKYYVIIARNSVKDRDGNGNSAQSISFSTGSDGGLVSFSPKNNATGVSATVKPTITFSEAIEAYDGKSSLNSRYLEDNVIVFKEDNSKGADIDFSAAYNSSSRVITITPTHSLDDGQKYYLAIANRTLRTTKDKTTISENVAWTTASKAKTVSKIDVKTQPTNRSYTAGDKLSLSGLAVTITYSDGSAEDVTFSSANFTSKGLTASPADGAVLTVADHNGKPVKITHTSSGKTANTSNLTVNPAKTVDAISVKTQPSKMTYNEGDSLSLSGLVVTVFYTDTTFKDVPLADFAANGLTASPANGTKLTVSAHNATTVKITHSPSGKTANTGSLTVTAIPKVVNGIQIMSQPTKMTYNEGEHLDLSGLVVRLTYTDATSSANINFANFSANGLTVNPSNGTVLTAADDGSTVNIMHVGAITSTDKLTVTVSEPPPDPEE